jgi:hypothetical protein
MLSMIEATHDPEKALNSLPPDGDFDTLVGLWARRDPQAALRWVSSNGGDEKESLLKTVAEGWAKKDWKAAAQWAATVDPESARPEIYAQIANTMSGKVTRDQAPTALAGLPQTFTDRVLLSLEHGGSKGEDQQAAAARVMEILQRNAGDEGFQSTASGTALDIARGIALSGDGKAAAAWVQALPPGQAQSASVEAVAAAWGEKDATAASEWLATIPAGEMREKGAVQLIDKIMGSDPQRALEWAKAMYDEEQRTEQIGKVLREWLPNDPFAAMETINALPADLRAKIWEDEEQ